MNKKNIWIETYTHKKFNPFYPKEELIEVEDIVQGLSQKCRFNGQSSKFYSVAHHSFYLAQLCSKENKIYALLHDAAEAYLPDIPSPLKPFIQGFEAVEDNLLRCILRSFNLKEEIPQEVKELDYQICFLEAEKLGFKTSEWWNIKDKIDLNINIWIGEDIKHMRQNYKYDLLLELNKLYLNK